MKKVLLGALIALCLVSVVFADNYNVDMIRDADNNWNGRIYEQKIVDNQLVLYLLGKNLDRTQCSRWDLVLEDTSGEIYRGYGTVSPNRRGTWMSYITLDFDAGTYNDVTVKYDCTSNDFWDISAENTFDFTIEEEQEEPQYCPWWYRYRGWC